MFRFLTSKKGFSMVELMLALLLMGLGAVALSNLVKVGYRAYNKTEERYIKQEAVKTVAELLRSGSTNVAAAKTADVFDVAEIVPTADVADKSYSYLYAKPHEDDNGNVDGYYIYVQNKDVKGNDVEPLCNVPIYIDIKPIREDLDGDDKDENQCGVYITLAALEDDFEYEFTTETIDGGYERQVLEKPTSDDIFYSLTVAYHFPNMVTDSTGITVNYPTRGVIATANVYDENGNVVNKTDEFGNPTGVPQGVEAIADDEESGTVLRVYCDSILTGDNTEKDITMSSFCFIATASYGEDSGEVGILCDFRDKVLLKSDLGTAFVKAYYTISPPIADWIADHDTAKAMVRASLKPLVSVASYALDTDGSVRAEGLPWAIMLMACVVGACTTVVVYKKTTKKREER